MTFSRTAPPATAALPQRRWRSYEMPAPGHADGRRPRQVGGGGRRREPVRDQALGWAASTSRAIRILSLTPAPAAPPVIPKSARLISVAAEKPAMG